MRRYRIALRSLREDLTRWPWEVMVNGVAAWRLTPRLARYAIYRLAGLDVHTLDIFWGARFLGANVHIARQVFINFGCVFEGRAAVHIGPRTRVGMEVLFCAVTHEYGDPDKRGGPLVHAPIEVGAGCWIGARVTVLPGVRIGDGCVIAAGAVVNRDCRPHGLYAGVPARRVRDLAGTGRAQSHQAAPTRAGRTGASDTQSDTLISTVRPPWVP